MNYIDNACMHKFLKKSTRFLKFLYNPTCAIFSQYWGFKDIKYDTLHCTLYNHIAQSHCTITLHIVHFILHIAHFSAFRQHFFASLFYFLGLLYGAYRCPMDAIFNESLLFIVQFLLKQFLLLWASQSSCQNTAAPLSLHRVVCWLPASIGLRLPPDCPAQLGTRSSNAAAATKTPAGAPTSSDLDFRMAPSGGEGLKVIFIFVFLLGFQATQVRSEFLVIRLLINQ